MILISKYFAQKDIPIFPLPSEVPAFNAPDPTALDVWPPTLASVLGA